MLTGITTAGVWVVALGLIGILLRQIGPWKKQADDAQAHFRDDLLDRVRRLEKQLDLERARRELANKRHEAERAADRHKLKNITACFDALLMLIEAAPEKAKQHVDRIKKMRVEQLAAETEEAMIIRAVDIEAEAQIVAEIASGEEELE